MKKNLLPFVLLAAVLGVALPASAITTTLEYEDARETNTLAVLRSEIVAATNSIVTVETDPVWESEKAGYATTNSLIAATNSLAGVAHSGSYADLSQIPKINTFELSGNMSSAGLNVRHVDNLLDNIGVPTDGNGGFVVSATRLSDGYVQEYCLVPRPHGDSMEAYWDCYNANSSTAESVPSVKVYVRDGGYYLNFFGLVYSLDNTSLGAWRVSDEYFSIDVKGYLNRIVTDYILNSATNALDVALRSAISSAAPADYSNVSNLAVTAVQPGDNVSVLANDAGYLTEFTETDPEWAAASPTITADIATNAADIAELQSTATFLYHIYSGSNAVFEVTNYNSQVHAPTARLLSLTNGAEYVCVWTETNGLSRIATAATNYTDSAILAATNRYAVRAWSATTSGLGADAPAETTWISTPTTVLAGGYEYTKTVTSSGQVWILTTNGMTTIGPDSQSYLDISSGSGDSLIKIEKTDSYLVGVAANNITVSGNTVTISVPVVSADHPYLRYAASLASPVTWYKEEDANLPTGVSVSWSGSSGAWVATVTSTASQGFFYFEFLQEGSTKITLGGGLDVTNGLYYNGTKYVPTVNGNKLEFIAE